MLGFETMAVTVSSSVPVVAATDAAKPDYDENGVDLSLVRYSLSLTPTQRLKAVENFMSAMASVRTAPPLPAESTKQMAVFDLGRLLLVLSEEQVEFIIACASVTGEFRPSLGGRALQGLKVRLGSFQDTLREGMSAGTSAATAAIGMNRWL